jgi:glycosyltransferase involved in cell wall biosynthesis
VIESATDVGAWSRALERLATEPSLRTELSRAGLQRVGQFAPDRTARQTLALYEARDPEGEA